MKTFNFKNWMISTLRRASYRWPPRYQTLNESRVERGKYRCAVCSSVEPRKNVQVDHIEPVVSAAGFVDWNNYIERMFCPRENFQTICKPCHNIKTQREKALRIPKEKQKRKSGS